MLPQFSKKPNDILAYLKACSKFTVIYKNKIIKAFIYRNA